MDKSIARQQHPNYHEGFADALDLTPLHYGMSPEYRSGWMAAHRCKRTLANMMPERQQNAAGNKLPKSGKELPERKYTPETPGEQP